MAAELAGNLQVPLCLLRTDASGVEAALWAVRHRFSWVAPSLAPLGSGVARLGRAQWGRKSGV